MAPHARVRYIIDEEQKNVPTKWFKEAFNHNKFDTKKQYLVFYSPGNRMTPKDVLKKYSKIPEFENVENLDLFDSEDASGYYRATVSVTADSLKELEDKIARKRCAPPPVQYVKESSFEQSQNKKPKKAVVCANKSTSSARSKRAVTSKKGKLEPSSLCKQQSKRCNVSLLKKKMLSFGVTDEGSGEGPKQNTETFDVEMPKLGTRTQKGTTEKFDYNKSKPGTSNLKSAMQVTSEVHSGCSDIEKKVTTQQKIELNRDNNAIESLSGQSISFKTANQPKSASESDDGSIESSTHDTIISQPKGNLRKQAPSSGSTSGSDEADDCYVPAEQHKEILETLKKKEAEIFRLRKLAERLRSNEQNRSLDAADDSQNISEPEGGTSDTGTKDDVATTPTTNPQPKHDEKEVNIEEDVNSYWQIFKRVNASVTVEKVKDLVKIEQGEKKDKPFVKLAAHIMWGSKYLREHSTSGQRNPKDKTAVKRPPLNKEGLKAIQAMLKLRVKAEIPGHDDDDDDERYKMSKVKRYIGEKIQSLINSARVTPNQPVEQP